MRACGEGADRARLAAKMNQRQWLQLQSTVRRGEGIVEKNEQESLE